MTPHTPFLAWWRDWVAVSCSCGWERLVRGTVAQASGIWGCHIAEVVKRSAEEGRSDGTGV